MVKKYYYLIGASYKCVNGGVGTISFTINQGKKGKYTNQGTLDFLADEAKKLAESGNSLKIESAFILSISYLGRMTEDEFNEKN